VDKLIKALHAEDCAAAGLMFTHPRAIASKKGNNQKCVLCLFSPSALLIFDMGSISSSFQNC
jgi:hypothetical protein